MSRLYQKLNPRVWYLLFGLFIFQGCNTTNRGKWEIVHEEGFSHAAAMEAIFFDSQEEGWALNWAQLDRIQDKGKTRTPVLKSINGEKAFYGFTFRTAKDGFVVGTQQKGDEHSVLILQTTDGGLSWQERSTNARTEPDRQKTLQLNSVGFCGEKTGWAAGDLILHTVDSGQTWQTQSDAPGGERVFSLACSSPERAWAVGPDGLLLRTTDGGNTWTRQELGTKDTLMRVRFYGSQGWIVGGAYGKSIVFRTNDGGETWQPQQLPVTKAQLFDIFFSGTHGWIAGEAGTILHSADNGQTWVQEKVPTTESLTSLFFLSPNQGWAGGDKLTLLRFSN